MNTVLNFVAICFWLLVLYYSILTVGGFLFRARKKPKTKPLKHYPSVAVLIPAHNEGVVMADTLHAMSKLEYPGELRIYLLNDSSTDETGEIAQYYDDSYAHIHHIEVPPGTPRGKSRVLNYGISISMIALEFSAFQLLMQAGRWGLFKLGSLTGTNLIIRRDILERVGEYDPYALAEDADLTLTLTHIGGLLPIVPDARTW
ncbi:glycosyltransferase family 2 protein [Paenibacillus cisolokensis]